MIKKTLVAIGLAIGLTSMAQAQDAYMGLSAGVASVDIDKSSFDDALRSVGVTGLSSDVDEEDVAFKVYGGYRFNQHFAIEGGYVNLGSSQYDATFTGGSAEVDWKSHGIFVEAVGFLPLSDAFSLLGKGGVYFSENEVDVSASGPGGNAVSSVDDNEVNLVLGLGAEYAFNDSFAMRAEWERFFDVGDEDRTGEGDVDLVTVGVMVKF